MNSTLRWPCYDGRVAICDLRNSVGSAASSQSATAKAVIGDTARQPDRGPKRE